MKSKWNVNILRYSEIEGENWTIWNTSVVIRAIKIDTLSQLIIISPLSFRCYSADWSRSELCI